MRLTLRCVLTMMRAVETVIDELVNLMRADPSYWSNMLTIQRVQRQARTLLSAMVDRMLDEGVGE